MADEKHYVYSARTTEKGLAILNKARKQMSWDQFINEAVCEHYKLDIGIVGLPPSKFIAEREAKRAAKEAEKAQKAADKKAKDDKKAADKKAKEKAAKKPEAKKPKAAKEPAKVTEETKDTVDKMLS